MILVQCSLRLIEEKLYKRQVFMCDINGSRRVVKTWKVIKEVVVQDLREPMKMSKIAEFEAFKQTFKYHSYGCATKFGQINSEKV
jgi:hypothetical protein